MILDTMRPPYSNTLLVKQNTKQKEVFTLGLEEIDFGGYSSLRLVRSDTGVCAQIASAGTADIMLDGRDFVILCVPEQ